MAAMMAAAHFFIPSSAFLDAEPLGLNDLGFSDKLFCLKKRIKGELIVTRGARGVVYIQDDALYQVAAPALPVKDTTGAGDNFHAAFALATAKGWDLHEAVRFSVAVASLSCREYGGRNGIPEENTALAMARQLKTIQI
jgi:sugar/nucleoside kinase (ribokinase family)